MRKRFCVVYRMGGFARFTWRRTLPVMRESEARNTLNALRVMGYDACHVVDYDLSMAIGLPDTFSLESRVDATLEA